MKSWNSGQALVEFAFFSVFSAVFIGLAGLLLKDEWNRSKCAYLTFERTHDQLIRRSYISERGFLFHVEVSSQQILGVGQCGRHFEKIRLPLLETAQW